MSVCEANVHSAEALKRARGTLSLPNFAAHGSLSRVILRQTGYTNKNVSVRHIFETNREAKLGRGAPWPTADAVSGLGKKLYSLTFVNFWHMGKKRVAQKGGGSVDQSLKARALSRTPRKKVLAGTLCVEATYNNTKVVLTDKEGNTLLWSSSGSLGFQGAKKELPLRRRRWEN